MKTTRPFHPGPGLALLALALATLPARAQLPAVISAPIAETISRRQITHQAVSGTLLARGKALAGSMTAVSGQIKGVVDRTRQLHDQWYSSLLAISAGVRGYRRVQEIYNHQAGMIALYGASLADLRRRGLSPDQLAGAAAIYQSLLAENVGLLGELLGVMSAGRAKMTDPERLEFINGIADKMGGQHDLMNYYTGKCRAMATLQAQAANDRASLHALLGSD